MAQRLATASKFTFSKHTVIMITMQIKQQYSLGQIKLNLQPKTIFAYQVVHCDPLKAKQSSKNEPVCAK